MSIEIMQKKLMEAGEHALTQISNAQSEEILEAVRVSTLGKKGSLSEVLKNLGSLSAEERPRVGALANEWKLKIETALQSKKELLQGAAMAARLDSEKIDVTLPARSLHLGAIHPISQTTQRLVEVFGRLGFKVVTGPEAETEFLNFEAVNIGPDHPARDMQDTFFLSPGVVLRTHTSAVQIREMMQTKPPIRILCPGAVYRCDDDATHSPMFHQIEGLWVDRNVKMSDLRGVLQFFAQELFGTKVKIRFRPSYFPFVEPGAEVDVSCPFCKQGGSKNDSGTSTSVCSVCKDSGWIEILGAGMVHPNLYRHAGYEESLVSEISGFAFGIGIERVAMLLHGVPDLRRFFENDIRFLKQFSL